MLRALDICSGNESVMRLCKSKSTNMSPEIWSLTRLNFFRKRMRYLLVQSACLLAVCQIYQSGGKQIPLIGWINPHPMPRNSQKLGSFSAHDPSRNPPCTSSLSPPSEKIMEAISETPFDLLVEGTGLAQSLLALSVNLPSGFSACLQLP